MNSDVMKGKLKQLTGEMKRKWGQLTDDDMMEANGNVEKLMGKIQERTGTPLCCTVQLPHTPCSQPT